MDFAAPARHDDVSIVAAGPSETQAFPEWNRGGKIVARNDGEGADDFWGGYELSLRFRCIRKSANVSRGKTNCDETEMGRPLVAELVTRSS